MYEKAKTESESLVVRQINSLSGGKSTFVHRKRINTAKEIQQV